MNSEEKFAAQFNMELNRDQYRGCGYDFTCLHTGRKYELKCDELSKFTGNVFIEIQQTADSGTTWEDSGFTLARRQADVFVMLLDGRYHFANCADLAGLIHRHFYPWGLTKVAASGNRQGVHARGYLIPVADFANIAYEITEEET